ncbi:MAG: 4-hydroxy-tetrahydrodipicolinate reductase, partial [Actinomycetota bacterium]
MVQIGVVGASGRLGTALVAAIDVAEDLSLVAAADSGNVGMVLEHPSRSPVAVVDSLQAFDFSTLDVVLEISSPESAAVNAEIALRNGCHVVIGTSGVGVSVQAELGALAEERQLGLLVVPNFALGGILLLRFAKEAARYFPSVEVIELHHPDKRDAPSGTATHTLAVLAEAREAAGMAEPPDATDMVGL